jgi:hypothetical protein
MRSVQHVIYGRPESKAKALPLPTEESDSTGSWVPINNAVDEWVATPAEANNVRVTHRDEGQLESITSTGLTENQLAYFDKEAAHHACVMQEYEEALKGLNVGQLDVLMTYTELRDRAQDEPDIIKWAKGRKGFKWAMERLGLSQ